MNMAELPQGYEVGELAAIDTLVRCKDHQGLATAILGWICASIQTERDPASNRFVIEPICVQYVGPYPAIGIRYLTQEAYDSPTLSNELRDAAARKLREYTLAEFVSYVTQSDESCDNRFEALCER